MQLTDIQVAIDQSLCALRSRLKSQSATSGIQVVCEYSNISAVESSSEIEWVLTSLIAEAIVAFSPQPAKILAKIHRPQITIRTLQIPDPQGNNPRVIVCLAHNGAEIPVEMQSRLFSAPGSTLCHCYDIVVNQHGGDLQCYSQSGRTEFWVELPIRRIQNRSC